MKKGSIITARESKQAASGRMQMYQPAQRLARGNAGESFSWYFCEKFFIKRLSWWHGAEACQRECRGGFNDFFFVKICSWKTSIVAWTMFMGQHSHINVTNDDNSKDDDLVTRTSVDIGTLLQKIIALLWTLLSNSCPELHWLCRSDCEWQRGQGKIAKVVVHG